MTGTTLIIWVSVMAISVTFTIFMVWITVKNNVWCRCNGNPTLHQADGMYYYACHNCGYIGKTGKSKKEALERWKF